MVPLRKTLPLFGPGRVPHWATTVSEGGREGGEGGRERGEGGRERGEGGREGGGEGGREGERGGREGEGRERAVADPEILSGGD